MKKEQIVYKKVSELKGNAKNPRKNDGAVDTVAKSIEKYGFRNPLIIDADNVVWCGNTRLKASKKLGLEEVPCIVVTDLDEQKMTELALLDNKTNEIAEWDTEMLAEILPEVDFAEFGEISWDIPEIVNNTEFEELEIKKREFEERMASGELSDDSEEYQEFLKKFEAKKTTDDCYTPSLVYDAVADYVSQKYGVAKKNFVRPFVPQGDYQAEKYKISDVVVDNPPFSILSEIIKYYTENKIKFFLFAPHLTIFSSASLLCSCLLCGVGITYENGAVVATSFVTNMEECAFRSCPKLFKAVSYANEENLKQTKKEMPKYTYPLSVVTSSMFTGYSRYGIEFQVNRDECYKISQLDEQKESGKGLFGNGYLISDKKKAEREKAEREKAEREKAEREKAQVWGLSNRELEIIKSLK